MVLDLVRACPRCTFPLTPYRHEQTGLDHCHRCGGSFVDPGAAAQAFGPASEPSYWKQSHAARGPQPSRLSCPTDGQSLEAFHVQFDGREVEVDTCPRCHGMWLDRNEGRMLHDIVYHAEWKAYRKREGLEKPGVLSYLFQILTGFPIEVWNPVRRTPWVVYSLVVLLTLLFIAELQNVDLLTEHGDELMLVPAQVSSGEHLWTLLTSGFLHASWFHLLGNLYFLWVFGDNVEDALGHGKFILVYLACLLGGSVGHLLFNLDSAVPMLGASGAISGLMGAYLALFPRVKVWVVFIVFRFRLGIQWYLAFWLGYQVLMMAAGVQAVAWFAHLGGFVTGLAIGLAIRSSTREELTAPHQV